MSLGLAMSVSVAMKKTVRKATKASSRVETR